MGYSTDFKGVLRFKSPVTTEMLAKLNTFFGENPREHPEWGLGRDSSYIDLQLMKDFTGIEWSGAEKTCFLEKSVNMVIDQMQREFPDFGLVGSLLAQGEDIEDRWELCIGEDGKAVKRPIPIPGQKVRCPHCHHHFYIE